MQAFIARENIKRFKEQLSSCDDAQKARTLRKLLAAEESRLAEIEGRTAQPPRIETVEQK